MRDKNIPEEGEGVPTPFLSLFQNDLNNMLKTQIYEFPCIIHKYFSAVFKYIIYSSNC